MSLTDENSSGNDPVGTPTPDDRLRGLVGDFTPSPSKVPMSLQKDMRGGTQTTTTTTTHSNITTFSSSASKALSASKYTSESFQKTFSEFGQIISQRRAELSEMKRANQFRMSNQLRHDLSSPSSDIKSVSSAQYSTSHSSSHSDLAESSSQNGDTPIAHQNNSATPRRLSPGSTSEGSGGAGHRQLARKLILSNQKEALPEDRSHGPPSSPSSSNLMDHMAAEQQQQQQEDSEQQQAPPSVLQEMAEQLQGEQERTRELDLKIHELHALEEGQRARALGLAQDKDRCVHSVHGCLAVAHYHSASMM
jgi:hypothetical protein